MKKWKVRIRWSHWIPKFLGVGAITLYPFIFFSGKSAINNTYRHEWIHIDQYRKHGYFGFLFKYALDYIKGRTKGLSHYQAYMNIPFEKEAYKKQTDYVLSLEAVQAYLRKVC